MLEKSEIWTKFCVPGLVPSPLLTKFHITNIRFEAITFFVYVIEMLVMNKFLIKLSATP